MPRPQKTASEKRSLIITADDYGLARGFNRGTLELAILKSRAFKNAVQDFSRVRHTSLK